ncbi:hypothetical protein [Psychroserpens sp.]|uniref:tetratricopeptide repeat protein n=1 Tax=Psychroserpens sp. TaxID=2020870 RepID=UPI002B267525|nr:hypothetical protein [Psychroserpens sp.]
MFTNKKKWINTLKFLAAYLVAAWTFLQFIDWILNRYSISPHWVDILLWIFIGIVPSLLIYLHNQERINKRILKLREKIIIPLNIILLIVTLYFGFGNSDLGATTKNVSFENSEGQVETKTITKEEFRIGIPIYGYKQEVEDSTTTWMRYGIGKLLYEDLLQNKSLSPDFAHFTTTTTKIREASLFYDFYVDGSYKKVGNEYEIKTFIRKASNGKKLNEHIIKGTDFLKLLDDISVFITSQAGYVESNAVNYLDLPIDEFMSSSLPAIEAFVNGNYYKAYELDKNFALAYLENAKRNSLYNKGKLETQDIIDRAFALKNKLPLQKQLEVFIQRNLAYNKYDEAEKQVKLQLEVDPNNEFYNQVLFSIYGNTKQVKAYLEKSEQLFEQDPKGDNGTNLAKATLINGQEKELLEALKPYEIISPNIAQMKLEPLIFSGDIKGAEKLVEELKIQNPKNSIRIKVYDSIIAHFNTNNPKTEDLEQFVGEYISNENEQSLELWIENDRIIQYISHQRMQTLLPSGPNSLGGGYVGESTWNYELIKNDNDKPIGFINSTNYWNGTVTNIFWKLDSSITSANEAFEAGNFTEAERLYEIAYTENPKHAYLKNILSHLKYTAKKGKDSLLRQHKRYSGNYGPRKFWLEDGKFFYKRKDDRVDLPRVELLAISENEYMHFSKLGTTMIFEVTKTNQIASVPYSFKAENMEWERLDGETNYFLKE